MTQSSIRPTINPRSPGRLGISLMEVLISIGVISLGIFGVASLIPVAQFKVAEGTALDRISAFGPSAAAEFRIRNMGSPNTWELHPFHQITFGGSSDGPNVNRKGFVIDPLGVIQGQELFFPAPPTGVQPMNIYSQMPWIMPRINLKTMPIGNAVSERVAQKTFYLADDVAFDRPDDEARQPRRQYFVNAQGVPVSTVPGAQFSWFATTSPVAAHLNFRSDEFLLSIVICKGRTPEFQFIDQSEFDAAVQAVNFPGELVVANDLAKSKPEAANWLSELKPGDWIMVAKSASMSDASKWFYRWTQIVGTSDEETDKLTGVRTLSIANDDFLGPGEVNLAQEKAARIFFVKGVESVFERTIRIQNTTAWDKP